ncbi:MAG TPA: hypothetical protein VGD45_20495 [Steroidobacter sp.]|uniref:hypothetical protein n=1 Tax=Steroidobacter sp. TaxID=1978227 RepID=UPI002ED84729
MADEQQKTADMQLAFRTEGQCFNAYVERHGTKPFVHLIGSVSINVCEADPLILATWEKLMALAVCRFAERLSGEPTQIIGRRTVPAGGTA